MKIVFISVLYCWILIKISDSKLYRVVVDDQFYPYSIDKRVPFVMEYFSMDNLKFEQIDDDKIMASGYGLCIKSLDSTLPLQFELSTQYLENSIWREGPIRLLLPTACPEILNPTRFWYNVTKLWTNCPPKKGEKWLVETQILNILLDLPPSFSKGPWRGYMLFSQGLFGSIARFGVMFQVEFIEF